eukprot:ANDGO_08642.mRNA.1 hypothetical protein
MPTNRMKRLFCVLSCVLLLSAWAVSAASPKRLDDWPSSLVIGSLHIDNIVVGAQSGNLYAFSANAYFDYPDLQGHDLTFTISGEIGGPSPLVLQFTGQQVGTWAPFPTSDMQLDFLKIQYDSTTGQGAVSGGTKFGSWTLEVDLDFVALTQPAIGFVVTDAKPSFNGLPGATAHAYDNINSLLNVGIVASTYTGEFQFTSGAKIQVNTGFNMFAASVFDGVTITYHGQFSFQSGFHLSLTADAQGFTLGPDIAVSDATITVSLDSPFVSMAVSAKWLDVPVQLTGSIGSTDIQFSGSSAGPWNIDHGKTPVVLTNMLITFDFNFAQKMTTGELKGTVTWGSFPPVTGIMKYPADGQALGCFSLTAIVGNPNVQLTSIVSQSTGDSSPGSSYPSDSQDLFGTDLTSIELSLYPNCGALFVGAELNSATFGQVDLGFALYDFVPVSTVLRTFANAIPVDPPVPISGSAYTVGTKEAFVSAADAFDAMNTSATDPILVPKAYIQNTFIKYAMNSIMTTIGAFRLPMLVQLTEHKVQIPVQELMGSVQTAVQSVDWITPVFYPNGTWEYLVQMTTQNAKWPLSEPAGVYLVNPSFALASASFEMTVGETTLIAQVGLNFAAGFLFSKSSTTSLNPVKNIISPSCGDTLVQVTGYIGNAQTGFFLQGLLAEGCIPLGDDLILSQTSLRVQSAVPQVSFSTVATLPKTQNLQLQASAVFGTDGTLQLSGATQSVYHTSIGAKPLDIDNINAQLSVHLMGNSSTFSVSLSGAITLDDEEEISVSASFDESSTSFSFTGTVHKDKPVKMFNLLERLIGDDVYNKIPMSPEMKDKLSSVYFVEGTLNFANSPPAIGGGLTVQFLTLLVSASLEFNNGQVSFGFSVQDTGHLAFPFKFSDLIPNVTIIDEFAMSHPVVILSTAPSQLSIPGIEMTYNTQTGLNFFAFLALDNSTPRSTQLTKWLGSNQVTVSGVLDPKDLSFSLNATSKLNNINIFSGISLTQAGFYIIFDAGLLSVGLESTVNIQLSKDTPSAANYISVMGSFEVSPTKAAVSTALISPWSNPFGVNGITVDAASISVELDDFVLSGFDFAGTVTVGSTTGSFEIILGGLDLFSAVLAASVKNLDLTKDVIAPICGKTPSGVFHNVVLGQTTLSLNPTLTTIKNYPPGIALDVQGLTLGPITLQEVSFAVDPVLGVRIQVDFQSSQTASISVGANGLVPVSDWKIILDLMLSINMGLHIDGNLNIAGTQCTSNIDIDLLHFQIAFNFSTPNVYVDLVGGVSSQSPSDFLGIADFTVAGDLDVHGYLGTRLPYYAQQTINQISPDMQGVLDQINKLQSEIQTLNNEIATRSQNDTQSKQEAEAAVQKAQAAVDSAKQQVQSINNQIAAAQQQLNKCGKYDYVCQAKYKSEILAYQGELATANAGLSVATDALNVALAVLQKIPDPDVDPVILEWKAELLSAQGALATLQGTYAADQAIVKKCSQVVQAGSGALISKQLHFSSSSFIGLKQNPSGDCEIVGNFLGNNIDIHIPINLNNIEQFVSDTWNKLKNM